MPDRLRNRLLAELEAIPLVDPHTHINPHAPAASSLADLLGYHYYTELAHSAGLPRERIEEPGLDPREKVRRLIECLPELDNTIQVSWLVEMAQKLFGFPHDRITPSNWEELYDAAGRAMAAADWPEQVRHKSRLEAVFLTNDFDDPLEGFDPLQRLRDPPGQPDVVVIAKHDIVGAGMAEQSREVAAGAQMPPVVFQQYDLAGRSIGVSFYQR